MTPQPVPEMSSPPWWRVGMVWLVLAGPLAVVVAGLITLAIALQSAEPVLQPDDRGRFADRPAVQGRNHAATEPAAR